MARQMREIVKIDEDLCDGCGDCVPSCEEGAIQIIDGKAKLVAENLCDGFGNCLGICPLGAITIEREEVEDFDEAAVEKHMKSVNMATPAPNQNAPGPTPINNISSTPAPAPLQNISHGGGCPGSAMRSFAPPPQSAVPENNPAPAGEVVSMLTQWPVQLMLVPPTAPFLKGRNLLLAADCCPFAMPDFHQRYLKDSSLLVGCPKLDDLQHYRQKLESVFRDSGCTKVTVMIMEVPCCGGLNSVAREALKESGSKIPYTEVVIGVRGNVISEKTYF